MTSLTRLDYHLVFVTKYRRPALAGLESSIYTAFRNAARGGKFEILEMGCDLGNHVHLVVRADPTVSISQLVRRLKQLTTLELWASEGPRLKKHYWKKKRLLWSNGYFASTVGAVSRDVVLDYVRKQAK